MADEETRRWPRAWIIGAVVAAVGLLSLLLLRDGEGPPPVNNSNQTNRAPIVDRGLCRRQLEDALEALQPSRLGITSSADDLAADLTNWSSDCTEFNVDQFQIEVQTLESLLQPDVFDRVIQERFDPRDAAHVRDCLLYRRVAVSIAAVHDVPLEWALAAFHLAVRQVALAPAGGDRVPLPCQYAAMFGRADGAHRAWFTAEVLRQLNVDCVIIEPAGTGPATEAASRLLGVVVPEEGVFLFDPAAGIPIPANADVGEDVNDLRPATLTEARNDADLLRRLDVPDGPAYPWTAEQLRDISVRVIGDSSFWTPRMAGLQSRLPGESSMTLYDGLTGDPDVSAGLLDRVRQAGADGRWDGEDVSLWDFPEEQIAGFYANGGEEGAAVADRMRVLNAPRLLVQQGDGSVVEVDSSRPLRMIRLQQLSGDRTEALKGLGAIRSAAIANPVVVNELAAEDAVYWIGICQYELNREEAALGNLDIYLREYPFGIWIESVRVLRARCLARLGRFEEAAQAMRDKAAGGSPLSFGEAWLARQWQARAAGELTGEDR